MVIDISTPEQWLLFRHESFQLWESQITGFLMKRTKDFVTINRDGVSVYSLGTQMKRVIKSDPNQEKMLHSLESTSYLKIDRKNLIVFDFSGEQKVISIMQQFQKEN